MITLELLDRLDDLGVVESEVDAFVGRMPTDIDNVTMIVTAPSALPDFYVDTQYLTVDIWTRNTSAEDAWDLLQEIRAVLHRQSNWDLPNYHVYFSHATGNIEDMDTDTQNRQLYKLSFQLIYRDINIIS